MDLREIFERGRVVVINTAHGENALAFLPAQVLIKSAFGQQTDGDHAGGVVWAVRVDDLDRVACRRSCCTLAVGFSLLCLQAQHVTFPGLVPLQRQSPEQSILDLLDRGLRQPAELPLQLRSGDALNLLHMEGAGPQERLGQIQFPAVAAQGSRVAENRHQVKLVASRFAREQQGRAHLGDHAEVH